MARKISKSQFKKKKQQQKNLAIITSVIVIVLGIIIVYTIVSTSSTNNQANQPSETSTEQIVRRTPQEDSATVLNANMALGNPKAKHHFVQYTDIFCPYCAKFSNAVAEHEDEFKQILEKGDIYYELRVTDLLTDEKNPVDSQLGGITSYCASDQGKFWEYYHALLQKIKSEYFDKGIGAYHGAPLIPNLENSFFYDVAKTVGIDMTKFESCSQDSSTLARLHEVDKRASGTIEGGLPYFNFEQYHASGFDGDWNTALQILKGSGVKF